MSHSHERQLARTARFWNRHARGYAAKAVGDQAAYEHKLALTRAGLAPEMRVLEVGCGTGTTALYHAPNVAQIDGVDYSTEMVDIARQKARDAGIENARFAASCIEDWPAPHPEGLYDAALAMSILHLVPDPHAALVTLRRNLKDGARLYASTVVLREMGGVMWLVARALRIIAPTGLLPSVRLLSCEELEDMMLRAGFEIETCWRPREKGSVFHIARAV